MWLDVGSVPAKIAAYTDVACEDRRHETDEHKNYAENGQEPTHTRLLQHPERVGWPMRQ
jgi:hypothetical protein